MKSRQINFFAMPDEWEPLEKYLEENELINIQTYLEGENVIPKEITAIGVKSYFLDKKFIDKLKVYFLEKRNEYSIDEINSPVMEFIRPYYDVEKNLLRRGRFYYIKGFWNDNGEWEDKSSEFLEKSDKLFKWFRKTYKDTKMPEFKGIVVTERVKSKIEKENLQLTQI